MSAFYIALGAFALAAFALVLVLLLGDGSAPAAGPADKPPTPAGGPVAPAEPSPARTPADYAAISRLALPAGASAGLLPPVSGLHADARLVHGPPTSLAEALLRCAPDGTCIGVLHNPGGAAIAPGKGRAAIGPGMASTVHSSLPVEERPAEWLMPPVAGSSVKPHDSAVFWGYPRSAAKPISAIQAAARKLDEDRAKGIVKPGGGDAAIATKAAAVHEKGINRNKGAVLGALKKALGG